MEEQILTSSPSERVELYLEFIRLFAKQLDNPKKYSKALGSNMIRLGLSLMALAPDSVVKAYIYWSGLSALNTDPEAMVDSFGDLILEMRKDLVGETTCRRDDIIGVFLRDQL